jgi:hypothetical protein
MESGATVTEGIYPEELSPNLFIFSNVAPHPSLVAKEGNLSVSEKLFS